jgi:hypothetical protein
MAGQVTDERVRQRLAVIPGFIGLDLVSGNMVSVLVVVAIVQNLPIAVDAHAVDCGFAVRAFAFLRLRASSSGRMKPRSMRAVPSWFNITNTPPRAIDTRTEAARRATAVT